MAGNPNVGIAFAMVIAAGASTGIGAAAVFFPRIVKLASNGVLAASLGFSAGVMLFVSFVEITVKSYLSFVESGMAANHAYFATTACFFGGMLLMKILSWMSHKLMDAGDDHADGHDHCDFVLPTPPTEIPNQAQTKVTRNPGEKDVEQAAEETQLVSTSDESNPASKKLDVDQKKADDRKLIKMGMNTALAIGIHNFPEGLATFVGALDDPAVGFSLAVAIAIHNIPEGLCVAMPVYYATGNRTKAFLWAMISGASEPIGALLGWIVLANSMGQETYGLLFGLVAGMMVMIVLRELIPTAHKHDKQDKYVTNAMGVGMLVMSASLMLFMV